MHVPVGTPRPLGTAPSTATTLSPTARCGVALVASTVDKCRVPARHGRCQCNGARQPRLNVKKKMETKTHFAPAGKVLEPRAGRGRLAVAPALRSLPPLRRPPGHPGCVRSALPHGDSPGPAALPRALPSPAPPRPGKRCAWRRGPQENPQDGRLPVMFTHWPGATLFLPKHT